MANESLKDRFNNMMGFGGEEKFDDQYDEGDEVIQDEETEDVTSRSSALAGLAGGAEVLVLDPEFFEDAPHIVDKIKENKTVVVNLKNTEYEDGRKIFDFLNGAVFALEGSINKIADNVFILAPSVVSVSKEMDNTGKDGYITPPILEYESDE
ncbi:MAG: cell division protein SepF [Eubacteriaceae bacterium]|nr:cell division protein SepF [Eubacteriaceae bacterium]MBR0383465.1 cell division protein SepF [Eubacteriaceae bacterium]